MYYLLNYSAISKKKGIPGAIRVGFGRFSHPVWPAGIPLQKCAFLAANRAFSGRFFVGVTVASPGVDPNEKSWFLFLFLFLFFPAFLY